MNQSEIACPKCQNKMVQGYVEDHLFGGIEISHWVSGRPKNDFFTGIKMTNNSIPIGVFRCQSCGFLESYARDEFVAN